LNASSGARRSRTIAALLDRSGRLPYTSLVTQWTISQVGRRVGLRPSAIRYYEEIGVVEPPARVGGQRRYDDTAVERLIVVQRARTLGFSLDEIRALFHEFPDDAPPAERWKQLAQRKLAQLAELSARIAEREQLLRQQGACGCSSLEECGRCLMEAEGAGPRTP